MTTKNALIIVTCIIFLVFFSNVVAGAARWGVFLSDVEEMLTLFLACVCFVLAMLVHERATSGTSADAANNES